MLDDVGHFVHIEQPRAGRRPRAGAPRRDAPCCLQHNKVAARAARAARRRRAARCSTSTASASARRPTVPAHLARVARAGVGPRPLRPRRLVGRRRRRLLLRGADGRRRHRHRPPRRRHDLRPRPRRLRRPARRRRPGRGRCGARSSPTVPVSPAAGPWPGSPVGRHRGRRRRHPGGTPDPWALHELTRDVRPPDYAATFARQASTRSGLDTAIAVVGVNRPPWLEGVVAEPGVVECTLATRPLAPRSPSVRGPTLRPSAVAPGARTGARSTRAPRASAGISAVLMAAMAASVSESMVGLDRRRRRRWPTSTVLDAARSPSAREVGAGRSSSSTAAWAASALAGGHARGAGWACPRGGRRRRACRWRTPRRRRRAGRRGAGRPRRAGRRRPTAPACSSSRRPASAAPTCSGRSIVYLPDL